MQVGAGYLVPQEFVEPEGPSDAIARRKSLRDSLLRKTLSEDDGTSKRPIGIYTHWR